MVLSQLDEHLGSLYETPTNYDIYDFLITDAASANSLTPDGHCANDERLLVLQSEDHLDISVYVGNDTLARLKDDDPLVGLHEGNLEAFMLALEGVSHFHYLCWNATYDKSVTLLELELQAEVDKYVTALMLLGAQGNSADANIVHQRLFEEFSYREDLQEEHLTRYQHANYYAAKYCRALSDNYPAAANQPSFINELRRFYRLPQNEKIRRIETTT